MCLFIQKLKFDEEFNNLWCIPMKDDGTCGWRTSSHQLYGDQKHYKLVRNYSLMFALSDRSMRPFVDKEERFDTVEQQLIHEFGEGQWMGQLGLAYVSLCYQTHVIVYMIDERDTMTLSPNVDSGKCIRVSFSETKKHINSLLDSKSYHSQTGYRGLINDTPGIYEKNALKKMDTNVINNQQYASFIKFICDYSQKIDDNKCKKIESNLSLSLISKQKQSIEIITPMMIDDETTPHINNDDETPTHIKCCFVQPTGYLCKNKNPKTQSLQNNAIITSISLDTKISDMEQKLSAALVQVNPSYKGIDPYLSIIYHLESNQSESLLWMTLREVLKFVAMRATFIHGSLLLDVKFDENKCIPPKIKNEVDITKETSNNLNNNNNNNLFHEINICDTKINDYTINMCLEKATKQHNNGTGKVLYRYTYFAEITTDAMFQYLKALDFFPSELAVYKFNVKYFNHWMMNNLQFDDPDIKHVFDKQYKNEILNQSKHFKQFRTLFKMTAHLIIENNKENNQKLRSMTETQANEKEFINPLMVPKSKVPTLEVPLDDENDEGKDDEKETQKKGGKDNDKKNDSKQFDRPWGFQTGLITIDQIESDSEIDDTLNLRINK